jgi:FkbM family methyltransferase
LKKLAKDIFYFFINVFTLFKGVRRTINGGSVVFPAKWSRYYNDGYEKGSFDFFRKCIKQGDTVLDIGSHIGVYSVYFASMVGEKGKVYCFEPTPSTFLILNKTIKLNKLTNTYAINAAISDKSGSIRFNLTTLDGEGSNANSMVAIERTNNHLNISSFSIDDFRKQNGLNINVLKIDVEGAELLALKGAKETFMYDKPCGILALHPQNIIDFNHSLKQIWECLMEYNLKVIYKGSEILMDEFCSQNDLFDVEFKTE